MIRLSFQRGWATNCFFHVRGPCDDCLFFSGGQAGVSACQPLQSNSACGLSPVLRSLYRPCHFLEARLAGQADYSPHISSCPASGEERLPPSGYAVLRVRGSRVSGALAATQRVLWLPKHTSYIESLPLVSHILKFFFNYTNIKEEDKIFLL